MASNKSELSGAAKIVGPSITLLLALGTVACSAFPVMSTSDSLSTKRQASATAATNTNAGATCGFAGNQDVYGLGIRLGLYAQWLSTYLSNWLHSANVTKMRSVNTCFQLAMFTALMAMANQDPKPHAIDPYIIIIQIMGSASTISKEATQKSQWSKTSWGGIIRFFIYWAVSLYAVWFWFIGIDGMAKDEGAGCIPTGFAFSKADISTGWFRIANKVASIIFGVVYTVLFSYSVYNFGPDAYHNGKAKFTTVYRRLPGHSAPVIQVVPDKTEPDNVLEQGLKEAVNGSMRLPKWTPALCFLLLFLAAMASEFVIAWNGVRDVNDIFSTGQLIPLVVGIGGLIQVLYKLKNQENRVHLVHRAPGHYPQK